MNVLSSTTPVGLVSETPKPAPSSIKLSPPPLKQNRLPRHIAIPIDGADERPTSSSCLISIMHGHDLSTPRDFSYPSDTFLMPPLAENSKDSAAERPVVTAMNDEIADFEVAMFSTIPRGLQARPSDRRAPSAAAPMRVARRTDSGVARPFFPTNEEFTDSPLDRQRFALLPKINLFQEKY